MNKTLKRYLISSGITFLTVFLTALSVQMGNWDADFITSSLIVSSLITATRAGLKALAEQLPKVK
jgi:hypothetical protein